MVGYIAMSSINCGDSHILRIILYVRKFLTLNKKKIIIYAYHTMWKRILCKKRKKLLFFFKFLYKIIYVRLGYHIDIPT